MHHFIHDFHNVWMEAFIQKSYPDTDFTYEPVVKYNVPVAKKYVCR